MSTKAKPKQVHVLADRWTRLSGAVEQKLFQIEREDRWQAALANGVIAGAAVAVVAWLVTSLNEGDLILFACLGSSSASIVFAPLARNNSLRTVIAAYAIASVVSLVLMPVHDLAILPMPWQCFFAVAMPVVFMRLTDTMHPAAIGSAMAAIIYDRDLREASLLLLAIIGLLTIVKVLAYVYLEELEFRQFGKEFRREYYGREMTVTVLESDSER